MGDQYVGAAGSERFDTAVTMAVQTWLENPDVPLKDVAARVVTEVFCMCVTEAEDEMEHHLSSVHAGRRAATGKETKRSPGTASDRRAFRDQL